VRASRPGRRSQPETLEHQAWTRPRPTIATGVDGPVNRPGDPESTGAREPEHTFRNPVPIVARIVWADDGAEHVDTVALGWTGREVYVRLPDRRYQFTAVWLAAADVTRR
jgi:hypothetical protein